MKCNETCNIPELESKTFSLEVGKDFQTEIAPDCWVNSGVEFAITILVQN